MARGRPFEFNYSVNTFLGKQIPSEAAAVVVEANVVCVVNIRGNGIELIRNLLEQGLLPCHSTRRDKMGIRCLWTPNWCVYGTNSYKMWSMEIIHVKGFEQLLNLGNFCRHKGQLKSDKMWFLSGSFIVASINNNIRLKIFSIKLKKNKQTRHNPNIFILNHVLRPVAPSVSWVPRGACRHSMK